MNKKVVVLGIIALLAISGLIASNMGFKLNYRLESAAAAGSATGTNVIALPYNAQSGILTADDLRQDIGAGNVNELQRFLEGNDGLEVYNGGRGQTAFPLAPGEAYFIKMGTGVDYIIVGSHNPSQVVSLDAPGAGSATGTNFFAVPYHITSANVSDLMDDIGRSSINEVQRFLEGTDGLEVYNGGRGQTAFPLVPGEGYFIKMNTTVAYTPSHY